MLLKPSDGYGQGIWLKNEIFYSGVDLVAPQITEAVNQVLHMPFMYGTDDKPIHKIRSVIFRGDGYPYKTDKNRERMVLGAAHPDSLAIVINLEKCFIEAVKEVNKRKEKYKDIMCSIFAVWYEFILTAVLHEAHHMMSLSDEKLRELIETDRKEFKKEEDAAELFSLHQFDEAVITLNLEPGTPWCSRFFREAILDFERKTGADTFRERHQDQIILMKKEAYMAVNTSKTANIPLWEYVTTFREYGRRVAQNPSDPRWKKDTTIEDLQAEAIPENPGVDFYKKTVLEVYSKIGKLIFGKCQPLISETKPFGKPETVENNPILLNSVQKSIITGFKGFTADKTGIAEFSTDKIGVLGLTIEGQHMPYYNLLLRTVDGSGIASRVLVPQHPFEKNGEEYTELAKETQLGARILKVFTDQGELVTHVRV